VEYQKDGKSFQEYGPVVLATGGYAADYEGETSLLKKYRPDVLHLPTTNGDHSTGDGLKMASEIGGNSIDMEKVQVHPTGLVDPKEPDAKIKFLAAEALRGVGGLLLEANGQRFCNELGHRDYVTGEMWKNKFPIRLVLNSAAAKEIEWHCKHYIGRGLMKKFDSGAALAKEMGISSQVLENTFAKYNEVAKSNKDPFGKQFFQNVPFTIKDEFYVSVVTPVVHYCMGGLEIDPDSLVIGKKGPIVGLFAAGEVAGGVHGANRLGGSSLLGCVVFGRVAGDSASRYLFQAVLSQQAVSGSGTATAAKRIATIAKHIVVDIDPSQSRVTVDVNWGDQQGEQPQFSASSPAFASLPAPVAHSPTPSVAPAAKVDRNREISAEEVAKHNKESDCWVIVNGQVLDVTKFLPDHPGGKKAILIYAGRDATEEFNMLHKPDVIEKYAPDAVIGVAKGGSKKH